MTLDFWQESIVRLTRTTQSGDTFATICYLSVPKLPKVRTDRRLDGLTPSLVETRHQSGAGRSGHCRCSICGRAFPAASSDRFHQVANMSSAGLELFAAVESHEVLAPGLWFQMTDLIKVHDRRAVDPDEAFCAEQRSQSVQRAPGQEGVIH